MRLASIWSQPAAAIIVVIGAALWISFSSFAVVDDKPDASAQTQLPPLRTGQILSEQFTAPADDLSRIDIYLDLKAPKSNGKIFLDLTEADKDSMLPSGKTAVKREAVISAGDIDSFDGSGRFDFQPVPASAGKRFVLDVSFDSGGGAPLHLLGEADPEAGRRLSLDGHALPGDLAISLYHRTGVAGLMARVRPFRPGGSGSALFLIPVFLVGAGAFGWLLWQIAAPRPSPGRPRTRLADGHKTDC